MSRSLSWIGLGLACLGLAGCDKKTAPPPPVVEAGPAETVNGTERLGWQQAAADAAEIAAIRYAIYVDNVRSELTSASCARAQGSADFGCAARLPSMTPGAHTLELAAFIVDGGIFESARSEALRVTVRSASAARAPSVGAWPSSILTTDGVRLRLERMADGLADPTDLAFVPDGRMFVAERGGSIRVVHNGRLLADPALVLSAFGSDDPHMLSIAVDPLFERTHFLYVVYTATSTSSQAAFALARFREASNTLADRVILLDDVPASPTGAAASLRFGPDRKLYVAFDDGAVAGLANDLASANGKVLRLNPDGTTPDDQAGGSPIYSYAYRSPRGFDWHPTSHVLWVADRGSQDRGRLAVVGEEGPRKRGLLRTALRLPAGTAPSSLAFYRGDAIAGFRDNLLIASDEGRHLLRLRLDPSDPTRVVSTERLLQDQIGGVRVVAIGPDAAVYVGTADALGRLVADQGRR